MNNDEVRILINQLINSNNEAHQKSDLNFGTIDVIRNHQTQMLLAIETLSVKIDVLSEELQKLTKL